MNDDENEFGPQGSNNERKREAYEGYEYQENMKRNMGREAASD